MQVGKHLLLLRLGTSLPSYSAAVGAAERKKGRPSYVIISTRSDGKNEDSNSPTNAA